VEFGRFGESALTIITPVTLHLSYLQKFKNAISLFQLLFNKPAFPENGQVSFL